jgi:hypothetical protein
MSLTPVAQVRLAMMLDDDDSHFDYGDDDMYERDEDLADYVDDYADHDGKFPYEEDEEDEGDGGGWGPPPAPLVLDTAGYMALARQVSALTQLGKQAREDAAGHAITALALAQNMQERRAATLVVNEFIHGGVSRAFLRDVLDAVPAPKGKQGALSMALAVLMLDKLKD